MEGRLNPTIGTEISKLKAYLLNSQYENFEQTIGEIGDECEAD
jgi:hypothetical protein